ncbi:zinc finger and SCAN domain-containing protein 12-like isoform X2 [Girardinichthys multiradiatus]|uniref:zinc finger and SCAN domain-containing protein 12-like isoform X2 n=1 Tax=Girardinichthys multiradiatus TaxID=208333 RepID=UPI001FADBCD0|nr:zinc finger and SCAN domain-containing protein 12-like isoform X2 [Girardinichthys multiradiatus]
MSHVEELKLFVAARLHAAASEILSVIVKTINNYEEETARLKEENKRHSSLLEIKLKKKLPKKKACHVTNSTTAEVAAKPTIDPTADPRNNPDAEDSAAGPSALDLGDICKTKKLIFNSNIEKIQDRSHWHCPCCEKIIYRRCTLKVHLSKQHNFTVLHPDQVTGNHHMPFNISFEEEPFSLEDLRQEEFSSPEQQEKTASLLLPMQKKAATGRCLNVVDAKHNSQPEQYSFHQNQAPEAGTDICLDTRIQDMREVIIMENNTTQVMETRQNSGVGKVLDSAGKMQHPNLTSVVTKGKCFSNTGESMAIQAASSSSDGLCPPSKKHAKNRSADLNLNTVKTELPASQDCIESYYCTACGEIFHYMHKLKMHVQKHVRDKICICGICGESLERSKSLHKHLQNHNKNICGTFGRQFSSNSRLQQHKSFHQPKTRNTKSTA